MGEQDDLGQRVAKLEAKTDDNTRRLDTLEGDIKVGINSVSAMVSDLRQRFGKVEGTTDTYRILVPVLTAAIGAESAAIIALLMR